MDNHRATVEYRTLKSNLVNLPSNLVNLLFTANIQVQDVIVEICPKDNQQQKQQQRYYAGWSGMSSSIVQSVEIDPVFAQALQIRDKSSVVINLKLGNYETSNINLEPLTSSDWEVVELNAQLIEDKLLNQTRCVAMNQILVVYPSSTTSAKLVVTDIGTTSHKFAKISPYCEIAIAPKVRKKKETVTETKSVASLKSNGKKMEDYSGTALLLKRGVCLPHNLYRDANKLDTGFKIFIDLDQLPKDTFDTFAAIAVVPGPNEYKNTLDKEVVEGGGGKDVKENRRIIAELVDYKGGSGNIGLSQDLAIALNIQGQIGNIIALRPAIKSLSKRPSTFVIHPYTIHSNKKKEINQTKTLKSAQMLKDALYPQIADTAITNFVKIRAIPGVLPYGGLVKFRSNDNYNAWIKPYDLEKKKPIRIELADELFRPQSFVIQEINNKQDYTSDKSIDETPIGINETIDDIVDSFLVSENTGTLVYGSSGSGKSLYLKQIGNRLNEEYGYFVKHISCESLMNENYQNLSKNHVFKWLQQCSWNQPSLLVLDNIDKIMNVETENMDATKSNQTTEYFISQLTKLHNQKNSNVSILCSAVSKESVNKLILGSHLIENYIHINAPDKALRYKILEGNLVNNLGCEISMDLMDLVSETEGYLPNDLKILSHRIYHQCLADSDSMEKQDKEEEEEKEKEKEEDSNNSNSNYHHHHHHVVSEEHVDKALSGYTPSSLRGVKLQKSGTSWSDIGGLTDAKKILLETLEWPTKYAPIFANCPLRLRSGILLYGYPGCGKTLLASAIAGQCGLNFISIKGPEILNKYIGASEQSVRELFERAQAAKPCILFFDEFDSIAPKRGHDSTGVTDRVVNQMLTQMDGAEGLDGVYVLAATSRPDLIDSALLRPGRLDKSVICDMPNFEDRLDILKSITTKMDLEENVDLDEIAKKTAGFSGADMQGLAYNAYLKAVHVRLDALEKEENSESAKEDESSVEFFKVGNEKESKMKSSERVKLLHQIQQFLNNEKSNRAKETTNDSGKKKVEQPKMLITQENFIDSLRETKPSISQSEKTKLRRIYSQFVDGRDGNMPDGSASNEIGGRTTLM
ncbi:PEX1 [Candida oxycetoniae]|uniref:Peroxisomal ATPase PEX1 n=1 Tax=Candida oxycetoniae TaxID=497107 RepID=A0AAI9WZI6_9ASCO|nr:PEX1 [Candida oxycetoniae]KAI3406446.2 PEX1 [Candida oxycetoniae]